MIYIIVRLVIFAITASILFLINKKKKIGRKAVITVLVIVAVVCEASALLGVDNHLISFSTPQKAYMYSHTGKAEIVADGAQSTFMVRNNGAESAEQYLIPKKGNRWTPSLGMNLFTVKEKREGNVSVSIYNCKGTDDYYAVVHYFSDTPKAISDTHNSSFDKYISIDFPEEKYYLNYAYIGVFDADYQVSIDDLVIKFE